MRPPNTCSRRPPAVRLLTGEGLGRISLAEDQLLFASGYDLKGYCHYLRVPAWAAAFFGLPA
eukprot:8756904-Alexandrium_andersonii.AAC.1